MTSDQKVWWNWIPVIRCLKVIKYTSMSSTLWVSQSSSPTNVHSPPSSRWFAGLAMLASSSWSIILLILVVFTSANCFLSTFCLLTLQLTLLQLSAAVACHQLKHLGAASGSTSLLLHYEAVPGRIPGPCSRHVSELHQVPYIEYLLTGSWV